MKIPVYIQFSWVAIILFVLTYCAIGRHFPGDNKPVLENGATLYDLVAFNGIKISTFFLALSFSTTMIYMTDTIKRTVLSHLKYFVFFVTYILFIRMCFHFVMYERITIIELALYGFGAICIISRSIYTYKKWQAH